jgi:hypothetical protein
MVKFLTDVRKQGKVIEAWAAGDEASHIEAGRAAIPRRTNRRTT